MWARGTREKMTFMSLCRNLGAKPCPPCADTSPVTANRLPALSLELSYPILGVGAHTRAGQCHRDDFRNSKLNLGSLDTPETLWERLKRGGQW